MAGRASIGGISEAEFTGLLQALSSTAKGRYFLAEYRRRSRPEETVLLLDAMRRIETAMDCVRDQLQPERIAGELRRVAMTLEIATDGAHADPQGDEPARRMALIDRARQEIAVLAEGLAGGLGPLVDIAGEDLIDDSENSEPPPFELIEDRLAWADQDGAERDISPDR
jgi:hypothetical protein